MISALDSVAADLEKSWKGVAGAEDQSASAAFQKAWSKFSAAIGEYAQGLEGAAGKLDDVADAIQSADEQAARLKEMALAALAVGAGLTLFTFGISDATAEAAAMADVAVATGEMSELAAALSFAADSLGDLLGTIGNIAARFAMGSGFSLAAEMLDKLAFRHENPLDPANYSAEDVANIIFGGMLNAGLGVAADNVEPISQFMGAHPVLGFTAYGAATGFIGGTVTQFAIEGKKLDAGTIEDIGVGTVLSGVGGAAAGQASGLIGRASGRIAGTDDGPAVTGPANWATAPSGGQPPGRRIEYSVRAELRFADGTMARSEAPVRLVSGPSLYRAVEGTQHRPRFRRCDLELIAPVMRARSGETVRGTLRVVPHRPVHARAIALLVARRQSVPRRRYWMSGQGLARDVVLGGAQEFPFEVQLGCDVPTMITPHLSVHWYLRAVVRYGQFARDSGEWELNVYTGPP